MKEIFRKHKSYIQEIFGGLDIQEREGTIEQLKKLGFHVENIIFFNYFEFEISKYEIIISLICLCEYAC
jgi:hypothetical protein